MEACDIIFYTIGVIIIILICYITIRCNLRSICKRSDDFIVCDKESVCVTPDEEFCKEFPTFAPYCDKYPPDVDADCPGLCGTDVSADARICFTAGGCASREPNGGKWTGQYEKCNKESISFCEGKGCVGFNCRNPDKICPSNCERDDPVTGANAKLCFEEPGCEARLDDGTWDPTSLYNNCNTKDVANLCKVEYGCEWAVCPERPNDLCVDTKCNLSNGTCKKTDGSCVCNDGWSGTTCNTPIR